MVDVNVGGSRRLKRLEVEERWAFLAGVLPLAGKSPVRGSLLIAEGEPVDEDDVAGEAGVTPAVAAGALDKLRRLGSIVPDDDNDCERVASWDVWNPAPPRSTTREATRDRKRLERQRRAERDQQAEEKRQPRLGRRGTAVRAVEPGCPGHAQDDRWDQARAAVVAGDPNADAFLADVHLHQSADGLEIAAHRGTAGWITDRYRHQLAEHAGVPVRVVTCVAAMRKDAAA